MTILLHLRIAGVLLLLLALMHFFLAKPLGWKEDLAKLTLLNRQIFLVHTFFIVLVLTMMGSLSLFFTKTLMCHSSLSCLNLGGLALFWLIRLIIQLFIYDARLWRGLRFNTIIHWIFTLLWTYLTVVYSVAFGLQRFT